MNFPRLLPDNKGMGLRIILNSTEAGAADTYPETLEQIEASEAIDTC